MTAICKTRKAAKLLDQNFDFQINKVVSTSLQGFGIVNKNNWPKDFWTD